MNSTKLSGLIVFPKKISRQRSRDFSLIQIQDSKIQSFNEIPSSSSTDAHILNHCLSLFCQAQNYSYLASLRNKCKYLFGNKFINHSYECGVKISTDNLNPNSGLMDRQCSDDYILKRFILFFCVGYE